MTRVDPTPARSPEGPFRVSFVTGVVPDKWVRAWSDRASASLVMVPVEQQEQLDHLRSGRADMAFVRLPVDRDGLHLIPLYRERPVAVVSKEHPVAAYDEIPVADLAEEHLLQDPDDVPAWRDLATEVRNGTRLPVPAMTLGQTVESVAAQAGIVVLPMSVARRHHRKDVVAVPVLGVEETQVGLAWPHDVDDPRIETFIGIVRGRTPRSSRGSAPEATDSRPARGGRDAQATAGSPRSAARKAGGRGGSRGTPRGSRGRRR